jgi:hypothetical protein
LQQEGQQTGMVGVLMVNAMLGSRIQGFPIIDCVNSMYICCSPSAGDTLQQWVNVGTAEPNLTISWRCLLLLQVLALCLLRAKY